MPLTTGRRPQIGIKGAESLTRPSELDLFLSSILWEEESGTSLTVLSLLARHDLDPWEEASRLTHMSLKAAAKSLADVIAAQAHRNGVMMDAKSAADRVLQSLPRAV